MKQMHIDICLHIYMNIGRCDTNVNDIYVDMYLGRLLLVH